jgi:hypothetical protein
MSLPHANGNGGRYPYFFCIARMRGTGCEQPYVQRLDGGATGRTAASSGGGSNEALTVGLAGLEPATFGPPARSRP